MQNNDNTKTSFLSVFDDLSVLSEIPNQDLFKNKLSFCLECWSIPKISIDKNKKILKCFCDKNVNHNSEFAISDYFMKMSSNSKNNISCLICHKTNDNSILKINDMKNNLISLNNQLHYCNECEAFFCYNCSKVHLIKQKKHCLLPMMKLENFCIFHNIVYSNYCMTCKKNICVKCLFEHNSHNIISLSDIFPFDPEITKKKLALNRQRKELLKVQMIFKEAMNNIYTKFNKLYEKKIDELEIIDNIIYTFERKPNNYNSINNFKNIEIGFEVFNYNFFSPDGNGKGNAMDDSIGIQKINKIFEFLGAKKNKSQKICKKNSKKNSSVIKTLSLDLKNKKAIIQNKNRQNKLIQSSTNFDSITDVNVSKSNSNSKNKLYKNLSEKKQPNLKNLSCNNINENSLKISMSANKNKYTKLKFEYIDKDRKNIKNITLKNNINYEENISNFNDEYFSSDKQIPCSTKNKIDAKKLIKQSPSKIRKKPNNVLKIKNRNRSREKLANISDSKIQNYKPLSENLSFGKNILKNDLSLQQKNNNKLIRRKKLIEISYLTDNKKEIMNMILLKDGNFATSSWDCTAKIFNSKDFNVILVIKEPEENDVCYITQLKDSTLLMCSKKMYNYKLYDNDTKCSLEYIINGYEDYIIKAIELQNNTLITCDWEYTIKIWERKFSNELNKLQYKLIKSNLNSGEHLSSIQKINNIEFIASSNRHLENGKDVLRFFDSEFKNNYTIYNISCSELADSLCQINKQYLCVALQKWSEGQLKGMAIVDLFKKQIIKNIISDAMTCVYRISDEFFITGGRDSSKKSMVRRWKINESGDINQVYELCTEQTDAITSIVVLRNKWILTSNYDSTIAIMK